MRVRAFRVLYDAVASHVICHSLLDCANQAVGCKTHSTSTCSIDQPTKYACASPATGYFLGGTLNQIVSGTPPHTHFGFASLLVHGKQCLTCGVAWCVSNFLCVRGHHGHGRGLLLCCWLSRLCDLHVHFGVLRSLHIWRMRSVRQWLLGGRGQRQHLRWYSLARVRASFVDSLLCMTHCDRGNPRACSVCCFSSCPVQECRVCE